MNTKQLECFLETGKYLSFTKAAQNLYLPQPAVSRYISALEQELGVTLFIRENSRHISFSDEGTLYFNFFQRYQAEFNNIRRMLTNSTTHVRLGYNVGWNLPFLPAVIKSCREENEEFEISLECLGFKDMLQGLNEKELDAVIITDDYVEGKTDILRQKFTTIPRIVVYSENLPDYEKIQSIADFQPYTFFMEDDPKIGALCQDIERLFKPYHFVPKFTALSGMDTVYASIENGLGVAVLDGWYQGIHHPGIHYLELTDQLDISFAWHGSTVSPSVDLFNNKIKEHFHIEHP